MELRSKQEMKLIVMFLFFTFVAFFAASCKIGFSSSLSILAYW